MSSLLVKNCRAFIANSFIETDILIENGIISTIKPRGLKGDERFDAHGMIVSPGLIDPHVHLREPGATYKEDFVTGTRAAIAGGFSCVMDMPNNKLPTTTKARLEEKIKLANEKALCDVLFHFGGTDDNFAEVTNAKPNSMKIYMGHTTGDLFLRKPDSLEHHFSNFPKNHRIVLDVWDSTGDDKKDPETSSDNLTRAFSLASKANRQIHLAHACRPEEVREAKKYQGCTMEVTPHHLFLSRRDFDHLGPLAKVNPPLQSEESRKGMWEVLRQADCIASDHAPHTIEDKDAGAFGFPGLETSLALMLDAYSHGLIEIEWLLPAMSTNVARVFGLKDRGEIRVGAKGDLTLIDVKKEWKIDHTELETKCKWTPFNGKSVKGKAIGTIISGKIVCLDGVIY